MNDLRTELNQLSDLRLIYVMARSKVNSDAAALRDSGLSKATFYGWELSEREHLNELAQAIKRSVAIRIITKLEDAGEDAVNALLATLKSRNENVKQKAAIEVLDRIIGKAPQTITGTGDNGEVIIKVQVGNDND